MLLMLFVWTAQAPDVPNTAALTLVALLPMSAYGVGDDIVQQVETNLLKAVGALPGFDGISSIDVLSLAWLKQVDAGRCEDRLPCWAKVADAAGAVVALQPKLGGFGGTLSISLGVIDVARRQELGRVAYPLPDQGAAQYESLRMMALELLQPENFVGALDIQSAPGAKVYLDNVYVGTTPIQPLSEVRVGAHVLQVSKPGFGSFYGFVDVAYGKRVPVRIELAGNRISGTVAFMESEFGELALLTNRPGLLAYLDGKLIGELPLDAPIAELREGEHLLSVEHDEIIHAVSQLHIRAGYRTTLLFDLDTEHNVVRSLPPQIQPLPQVVTASETPTPQAPSSFQEFLKDHQAAYQPWRPEGRFTYGVALAGAGVLTFIGAGVIGSQAKGVADSGLALTELISGKDAIPPGDPGYQGVHDAYRPLHRELSQLTSTKKLLYIVGQVGLSLVGAALSGFGGWTAYDDFVSRHDPDAEYFYKVDPSLSQIGTGVADRDTLSPSERPKTEE